MNITEDAEDAVCEALTRIIRGQENRSLVPLCPLITGGQYEKTDRYYSNIVITMWV